jgi:DNA/RNA-binding protein KIN17
LNKPFTTASLLVPSVDLGYTSILRLRFNGRRVHANEAYKEYIAERHHIHMNSTIWETLTEYVIWLGKSKICKVDNTEEKGWFVTYIDQNPWDIGKKDRDPKDDSEREKDFIERQVERGKDDSDLFKKPDTIASSLKRKRTDERIQLELKVKNSLTSTSIEEDVDDSVKKAFRIKKQSPRVRRREEDFELGSWNIEDVKDKMYSLEELVANDPDNMSNVEELKKQVERLEMLIEREKYKVMMEQEEDSSSSDEEVEEDARRTENWVRRGIVVKVMARNLGDKFYRQKGYVRELSDKFTAIVVMVDSGSKVKLDQSYLETVIPGIGKNVIVCNGRRRGLVGMLKTIDRENFCGTLEFRAKSGKVETFDLPYEDFSKAHQQGEGL